MSQYRGTTPTHTFNTSVDLTAAEVVYLTYKQGSNKIEKTKDEFDKFTAEKIVVKLSQKDTLKFKNRDVQIQVRARFMDGTAIASNIINTTMMEILKDGEI